MCLRSRTKCLRSGTHRSRDKHFVLLLNKIDYILDFNTSGVLELKTRLSGLTIFFFLQLSIHLFLRSPLAPISTDSIRGESFTASEYCKMVKCHKGASC
jgi:hypothetical protein